MHHHWQAARAVRGRMPAMVERAADGAAVACDKRSTPRPVVGTPAAIMRSSPPRKARNMEPEHVNAIGNALEGLKSRTRELRRYL
jgi:hypothetical protein